MQNTGHYKGVFYVIAQMLLLLLLLAGTPVAQISLTAYLLLFIAIALMLWSILTMRKSKLCVLPELHRQASLITGGPYGLVRHPMYTSLMLGSVALLVIYFTWPRLLLAFLLLVTLIFKLTYEEKMLLARFDSYKTYMKQTYRMVPFIY